jgi:deoxycytidine triphosphate deaminase
MYLTDAQLRARLSDFEFVAEDTELPFDEDQIGPCSIDLRLSLTYWTPKTRGRKSQQVVDLERSKLMELSPNRGWRKHELKPGEKISIAPGGMVLGRVSEDFRMPSDCAGAIEGRSSFARLGLSVHASAGFINPGWRGHMPLTLVNHSPATIRIPVGTPVCQLMVIQLSERVEADYAQRSDRKYLNDTGGPSYWWRDKHMQQIRNSMESVHIQSRVFDELDELLLDLENEDMLDRLETFVAKQRARSYGSADELLEKFAEEEGRARTRENIGRFVGTGLVSIPLAAGVTVYLGDYEVWVRVLWTVLTALAGVLAVLTVASDRGEYLTTGLLQRLQQERSRRRPDQAPSTSQRDRPGAGDAD